MAGVIIRLRVVITPRGITNRRRAITRHRATTNKAHATIRRRERRTGLIRIGAAGTAVTGVAGMMTGVVGAGVIIGDVAIMTVDVAITMDGATTADLRAEKKRRIERRFFMPVINPIGQRLWEQSLLPQMSLSQNVTRIFTRWTNPPTDAALPTLCESVPPRPLQAHG